MMRRLLLLATIPLVALAATTSIACGGGKKQEVAVTPEEATSVAGAPMAAAPPPGESGPPQEMIDAALKLIAEREGLDAGKLVLAAATTNQYPLSGKLAYSFKVLDSATGKMYAISIGPDGKEVDSEELLAGEEAAYNEKYGNLEAALFDQLASASADKPVDVIIRLKMPPYEAPLRPDDSDKALGQDQVDALYKLADQKRAEAVAGVTKPALDSLQAMGFKGTADAYDPVIYASLKPDEVHKVQDLAGINRIYSSPVFEPTLDIARQAVHANVVNTRGMTGSGVKTADIEVGGQINTANPKLANVVQDTTYSCLHDHAAAVGGIIVSAFANGTANSIEGIASAASLWMGGSCNGNVSELENRSTAAADWGARVLNYSLGYTACTGMTAFDNYLDGLVSNRWRSVAVAAGNRGNSDKCVTSPGLAYNVITVGASDDHNTTDWSDDTVASYSSWTNPTSTHNDREEPDVMAPGTNFTSTKNASPWTGDVGSGTSYATPVVTGIVALLIQRNPTLAVVPPAVRAIIMASAAHNIEGDARLSGKDGAGEVVADWADDVADRAGGSAAWSYMNYNLTSANPTDWTLSLVAGKPTRVVIAWDSDPDMDSYLSQPPGDVDLQVLDPSGSVVASSASFDNTYEIVYFTPATAGHYKLRVIRSRWDQQTQMLAWALFQGDPALLPTPVPPTSTPTPRPAATNTPPPRTPTPAPAAIPTKTPTPRPTATPTKTRTPGPSSTAKSATPTKRPTRGLPTPYM
jgi:Subtilase family